MEEFWSRFWPVFAATFLGVSISFVLDRLIERWRERRRLWERRDRLMFALDAVTEAIEHNKEMLEKLRGVISSGGFSLDPALDA